MIIVQFKESRVLLEELLKIGTPLANVSVSDEQAPRYVSKGYLRRDVSCCAHSHQMTMLTKRDRVLDRWVEYAILFAPLSESLIFRHSLQLSGPFPVHAMMQILNILIALKVSNIAGSEALYT